MTHDRFLNNRPWLFAAALAMICVAAFFNSLHNDFMMDDYGLILQETRGHNPRHLLNEFLPEDHRLNAMRGRPEHVYYRPWAHIIPLGCYALFRDDPFGYHVVNLILFWLSALCVFGFIRYAFKDSTLAFLTSLFFIIHPINGLTVNYITASVFSWQVIAMMLGLIAAMKATEQKSHSVNYGDAYLIQRNDKQLGTRPRNYRWMWLILGLFAFLNALLCHETALAFPFYLTACLLLIKRLSWKDAAKYSSPFWLAAAGYFFWRLFFASLKANLFDKVTDITIAQYLATFVKLILWYFKCFFTLDGIVLIWSTPVVKQQEWIWIFILMIGILSAVFVFVRLRRSPHAIWPVWILIGFLPVTLGCFFQPKSGLMIEPHWLIVASVGLFAGLSGLLLAARQEIRRVYWFGAVTLIVISLTATGWQYNRLWGNEEKYCLYWLKESPHMKRFLFYLADVYAKRGDYELAMATYFQALENSILDYEVFNNLGLIARDEGDWKAAEDYFFKALKIHPQSPVVLTNLGTVYWNQDKIQEAKKYFHAALELNPFLIEPRLNLAGILQEEGEIDEAIRLYQENDRIDLTHETNLFNWLNALVRSNGQDLDVLAGRILKLSRNAAHLTQVGSLLAAHQRFDLAERFFQKALKVNPDGKEAYLEAGKMLGNLNDFDAAILIWQDGARRFPVEPQFHALILQAQELKKGVQ